MPSNPWRPPRKTPISGALPELHRGSAGDPEWCSCEIDHLVAPSTRFAAAR
jgi:hypothetical protein